MTATAMRFWSHVTFPRGGAGCWLWVGAKKPHGYGNFGVPPRKTVLPHRFSYELQFGAVPSGMQLDHLCRNPACVNPAHLEPVTAKENHRRQSAAVTHCPSDHPYDQKNTYLYPNGNRRCRECGKIAARARRLHLTEARR